MLERHKDLLMPFYDHHPGLPQLPRVFLPVAHTHLGGTTSIRGVNCIVDAIKK